jgi:hypothetical protein
MTKKTKAPQVITTAITKSYARNYVLYLGGFKATKLSPGTILVRMVGHDDFETEGSLNANGALSGMAKVYAALSLRPKDKLDLQVLSKSELAVVPLRPPKFKFRLNKPTVFASKKLKHIHFEAFRPQNLVDWKPKAEVDVYMTFGILEKYTPFKYCCGLTEEILRQLGTKIDPKPDAILIDRITDEYLIAEFEKSSSDFVKGKHKPNDVDVLVCWFNDERDRSKLPQIVLCLAEKAQEAALEILGFEEDAKPKS